jgi:hypothetical protein
MENEGGKGKGKQKEKEEPTGEHEIVKPAKVEGTLSYKGPVHFIQTTVEWQTPERGPYCEHIHRSIKLHLDVPLTAKVRVLANRDADRKP